MATKTTKAPAAANNNSLPEWVDETPEASSYSLAMFAGGGESEQEVNLTRDEFIRLKRRLAVMRGLK